MLTPEVIVELEKLHLRIDISGIMEIVYRNINFYSEQPIYWQGRACTPREFWASLAKEYGDHRLEKLCKEKYWGKILVEEALAKHDRECQVAHLFTATQSSPMTCTFNSDGTLNMVLKFIYDRAYSHSFQADYYKKRFDILKHFTDDQLKKAKVTKIGVDLFNPSDNSFYHDYKIKNINDSHYLLNLLIAINQHLVVSKNQFELVIQGLYYMQAKHFQMELQLAQVLTELIKKYSQVTLNNIQITTDFSAHNKKRNESNAAQKLFQFFSLPNVQSKITFSFDRGYHCTVSLCQSDNATQSVVLEYQDQFDLQDYAWLQQPVSLTLNQVGKIRTPWKASHLRSLNIQKLTIVNTILNSQFVDEVKNMSHLTHLEFKECEVAPECQKELNDMLQRMKKVRNDVQEWNEAINNVEEAIKLNDAACRTSHLQKDSYAADSCQPKCEINPDGTTNLVLAFKLDEKYLGNKWNPNHYKKRLSFAYDHLNGKDIANAHFSSLIFDVRDVQSTLPHPGYPDVDVGTYLSYLLRDVYKNFQIFRGNEHDFMIRGLPAAFFEGMSLNVEKLDSRTESLINLLKKLLKVHRHVCLCDCKTTNLKFLGNLYKWVKIEGFSLEISFKDKELLLALRKSDQSCINYRVNCDEQNVDLAQLKWVQHPLHLILEHSVKKSWDALNLNVLHVQNLTIKNVILNQKFADQLKYGNGNHNQMEELACLTLKDCELEKTVQEQIEESFMWRSATRDEDEPERKLVIEVSH
jgi:hypothetical protein